MPLPQQELEAIERRIAACDEIVSVYGQGSRIGANAAEQRVRICAERDNLKQYISRQEATR